jgi:hypothetical protein
LISKKSIALGAVALTIVGTTAFVSTSAFAQNMGDGHTNMIQKLAQKLGVPEDKVKGAFDEIHNERHAEMQKNHEQKLNTLVSEGKITEAQKAAIIAKMEEMKSKMEANKDAFMNMTPEERKAKIEAEHAELENWAKAQGLDLSTLPFGMGGKMIMKFKGHEGGPKRDVMFHEAMPVPSQTAQ